MGDVWRHLSCFLLLVLIGGGAQADDGDEQPEPSNRYQVANAVVEAVAAGDAAALETLAAMDDPDPWFVVEELLKRGERDAALAFATSAVRPDTELLAAYVSADRDEAREAEARRLVDRVAEARVTGGDQGVVDAVGDDLPTLDSLPALFVARDRASAFENLGRWDEAYSAFWDAALASEQMGWLQSAAVAFESAATAAYLSEELGTADAAYIRYAAVSKRRGDLTGEAASALHRGYIANRRGQVVDGLALSRRALALFEALGEEDGASAATNSIGSSLMNLGSMDEALTVFQKSLASAEARDDAEGRIVALFNIASIQKFRSDLPEARETLERARALCIAWNPDSEHLALILIGLGDLSEDQGDYLSARDAYSRALAWETAHGRELSRAQALRKLAAIHMRLGEFPAALGRLEEVLAISEDLGDPVGLGETLYLLATTYMRLGDPARAKVYALRALDLDVQAVLGKHVFLSALGTIHADLDEHEEALACFEQALALAEESGARGSVALILGNLAIVQSDLGDMAAALETAQRSLEMKTEIGDRSGAAAVLGNIGGYHAELGHFADAADAYERAVATALELYRPGIALTSLRGLASVLWKSGDFDAAVKRAREGIALLERYRVGLAPEQQVMVREQSRNLFRTGFAAAAAAWRFEDVHYFVESQRAVTLLDALGGREAVGDRVLAPELAAAERDARAAEAQAVTTLREALEGGKRKDIRRSRKAVARARAALEEVIWRIQREAQAGADLVASAPGTLADTQRALGSNEAFVLFSGNAAFVVTHDDAAVVELAPHADISAAVDKLLLDREPRVDATVVPLLREMVVDRLRLAPDVDRILVSPHGVLSFVPFALLAPELEVVYVPSATTYRVLARQADERGEGVLGLGDPLYARAGTAVPAPARDGSLRRLAPLPGSGAEVEAIATVKLLGEDATAANLEATLTKQARWRAVHLACHGHADSASPAFSWLALTPGPDDHGLLTALDVFRWRVPADLVVLSACETGRGKVYKTEGIAGLTRAFMHAGAPRVICSLWKVDDAATRALMVKFYELWHPDDGSKGLGAADALRQAQAHVRSQARWEQPYFWAAWVLWGLPE